jgi:hypothetical protein
VAFRKKRMYVKIIKKIKMQFSMVVFRKKRRWNYPMSGGLKDGWGFHSPE